MFAPAKCVTNHYRVEKLLFDGTVNLHSTKRHFPKQGQGKNKETLFSVYNVKRKASPIREQQKLEFVLSLHNTTC